MKIEKKNLPERFKSSEIKGKQKIEKLPKKEEKQIINSGGFWGDILKRYKQNKKDISAMDVSEEKAQLEEKIKNEKDSIEKQRIIDGVNFSRAQIQEIVDDYKNGKKVEFDVFTPYLSDNNTVTGEIWRDKLIKEDKESLKIAEKTRKIFPKAKSVTIADDLNSGMPDTANVYGAPFVSSTARQIEFSKSTKSYFKYDTEQVLRENNVIKKDDKEGEQYLIILESEKIVDAEELVRRLEARGYIERNGEEIKFVNPDSENPDYSKIVLRKKNGSWQCAALDASSYIKPENLDITHLVILPNYFIEQQDKVWEILKVLGIKPDRYHNIFYDEKLEPGKAAEIIEREFKKYI